MAYGGIYLADEFILETSGLTKEFAGFFAVRDVALKVRRGSIHALIGPNGAGKTTCFNLLTKFLKPSGGQIRYKGQDITAMPPADVARLGLVRSFQISAVFPHLTALENVRVALQRQHGSSFDFWRSKSVLDRFNPRAHELLNDVGLSEFANTPAVEMPADLPLSDLQGQAVTAASLHGQWLLAVVQPAACGAACERQLYVQRQLREMLGKERDRVDKLWLIPDDARPRAELLAALVQKGAEVTVLRLPRERLEGWLKPAAGKTLADHFYVVDPMGRWMLRAPGEPEPRKFKADLDKLLRASAGWDAAGR